MMNSFLIASFLTIALLCNFSFVDSAFAQTELTFSSATEVSPRSKITVYDIVEAKNLSNEMVEDLRTIEIAGQKDLRIEKAQLAKALRHLRARFKFPSEVKLIRSRNEVSRMEVERKIKNRLQMNCFNCDLQIQVSSVPVNMDSDWDLDLNLDLAKSSLTIPIFSASHPERRAWVVVQVKRFQNLPVLNQAVRMGEVIKSEMFGFEKRMVLNPREVVMDLRQVEGMQATRFLTSGQTINLSDLKKETVMRRGQLVKVVAGTRKFELAITGQVEEAGSVGDAIRIKNPDSQKVFVARVLDAGTVRVEP